MTEGIRQRDPGGHVSRRDLLRGGMGLIVSLSALTAIGACTSAPAPTAAPAQPTPKPEQAKPAQPTAAAAASKPTEAPAAKPTAAAASTGAIKAPSNPVTLKVWHHWGGTRIPLMEKMFKDFAAKYPTIKVEPTLLPWERRTEKILSAVAAGTPPDVAMFGRQEIPNFVLSNAVTALDDFMKRDGVSKEMFVPAEINACVYEGKTWILPIPTGGSYPVIHYNADMFKEAGAKEPATIPELEATAKQFTKIESGKVTKLGYDVGWDETQFQHWVYLLGGKVYSDDGRKVVLEKGVETLQWMLDFTNNINGGEKALAGWVTPAMGTPFYTGFQAMRIDGVWGWFILKTEAPKLNAGTFLRPAAAGQEKRYPVLDGHGYIIPKGAKNPEPSWLMVKWLTVDEEAAGWFMLEQGRPSPIKKYNDNPAYKEKNPFWALILKAMELSFTPIYTPADLEVRNAFTPEIQAVYLGKKKPDEAVKAMIANAQKALDEAYSRFGR